MERRMSRRRALRLPPLRNRAPVSRRRRALGLPPPSRVDVVMELNPIMLGRWIRVRLKICR
ncbi:hypothetical protein PAHAL_2G026900 [Panicum hallii]|uniref:Uncharacterized protein n=1 Tax=Panicum hallii TaxID=206008 RepID=A0A2S3GVI8_9POAL|nr:hypothetical protein PAHAL_2G026900 [Panicum hallii]